ncbi:hypothetical protein MTO96_010674 [Rhipicephalus appendiculatus]
MKKKSTYFRVHLYKDSAPSPRAGGRRKGVVSRVGRQCLRGGWPRRKLRNARTVLWPPDTFLSNEVLTETYANFSANLTFGTSLFIDYWIDAQRNLRALYDVPSLAGRAQPAAQLRPPVLRLRLPAEPRTHIGGRPERHPKGDAGHARPWSTVASASRTPASCSEPWTAAD